MGPRSCIGRWFAMLEMRIIVARMVLAYDWTSVDEELCKIFGITMSPETVRIKFRTLQTS